MKKPKVRPANINKAWMAHIKKTVPGVTYISFESQGEDSWIKIIITNELGDGKGKDTVRFKMLEKIMRSEEWEHIIDVLKSKSYLKEAIVSITETPIANIGNIENYMKKDDTEGNIPKLSTQQ